MLKKHEDEIKNELKKLTNLAEELLLKAQELSDQHGIKFVSPVSLKKEEYVPESYLENLEEQFIEAVKKANEKVREKIKEIEQIAEEFGVPVEFPNMSAQCIYTPYSMNKKWPDIKPYELDIEVYPGSADGWYSSVIC